MAAPTSFTLDGVEHEIEGLSDQSKMYLNHINNLERKIDQGRFNINELQVGRDAFVALLRESLKNEDDNGENGNGSAQAD